MGEDGINTAINELGKVPTPGSYGQLHPIQNISPRDGAYSYVWNGLSCILLPNPVLPQQVGEEIRICCSKSLQLHLADVRLLALSSATMLSAMLAPSWSLPHQSALWLCPENCERFAPFGIKQRKKKLSGN